MRSSANRFGRSWATGFPLIALLAFVLASPPLFAASSGLTTPDGAELENGALDQGTVIAVVYASWSPRCRKVAPQVEEIQKKWGDEARVLLVSFQEGADDVEAFLGDRRWPFEVGLDQDGSFSKRHAITYLPGLLVLREGKTVFSGKLPPRDVDSLLEQILN